MDPRFWHERWALNEIGFHQPEFNALLTGYWPGLVPGAEAGPVFVPLCGKSGDMVWLRQRGHEVIGIELSTVAVADFFREQSVPFTTETVDGLIRCEGQGYEIYCGDFFDLKPRYLENARAIYDRGALVALPRPLQERYVRHLDRLLPEPIPILLITLEYKQDEMEGPPFSTPESRVAELFADRYRIEKLSSRDILEGHPGLKNKGLTGLTEIVYALRPPVLDAALGGLR